MAKENESSADQCAEERKRRKVYCPILRKFRDRQQRSGANLSKLLSIQMGYERIDDIKLCGVYKSQSSSALSYHVDIRCPICKPETERLDLGSYPDYESAMLIFEAHDLMHDKKTSLTLLSPSDKPMLRLLNITRCDRTKAGTNKSVLAHIEDRVRRTPGIRRSSEIIRIDCDDNEQQDRIIHSGSVLKKQRTSTTARKSAEATYGERRVSAESAMKRFSVPVTPAATLAPHMRETPVITSTSSASVSVSIPATAPPLTSTPASHSSTSALVSVSSKAPLSSRPSDATSKPSAAARTAPSLTSLDEDTDTDIEKDAKPVITTADESRIQYYLGVPEFAQLDFLEHLLYCAMLGKPPDAGERSKRVRLAAMSCPNAFRWGSTEDNVRMCVLLNRWLLLELQSLQRDAAHSVRVLQTLLRLVQEGFRYDGWTKEIINELKFHKIMLGLTIVPQCHREQYLGYRESYNSSIADVAKNICVTMNRLRKQEDVAGT